MATISDVAKRAGVSPGTVSRVINGARNVTPEIRVRVEQAIEELNYIPNVVARSLRSKRTLSLALLVADITNIFWTTVARGVEDAAQSRDYSVLLCNTDQSPAKQRRYLEIVASQRVDGVIIAPYNSDARQLARLRERNIPTVIIDRRVERWDVDTVYGDSISGARALTRHLIELGHRRIAVISGPPAISTADDRVAGYCMAMHEAGLPLEPGLIKRGEYRPASGEHLTYQLLEEQLQPTAIFATNNAIARGVVSALEKRGRRIPQDLALVCFGDFHPDSRFYTFLTAIVQPAYDIGANAAQLLFSRLDHDGNAATRRVVLPTRLRVGYSCGSRPEERPDRTDLLIPTETLPAGILVKPLSPEEQQSLSNYLPEVAGLVSGRDTALVGRDKPDVQRLLKALRHQEGDRLPNLELWLDSRPVFEYVLGRTIGQGPVSPEDHVEFARRLGMDAVICPFSWRPNHVLEQGQDGHQRYLNGPVKTWTDLDDLERPPSLTDQLSRLEGYLRAAQGSGVGVIAGFTSFFDTALIAAGRRDAADLLRHNRRLLEALMDMLLEHQEQVMRTVCGRFAADLALVAIRDDLTCRTTFSMPPDLFDQIFTERMKRLLAPAKEYDKPVIIHTPGALADILPLLHRLGFDAVHPVDPEHNDIFALKKAWAGKMALMGGFPPSLLARGSEAEIEAKVQEYCQELAGGGDYVLGTGGCVSEEIPPENLAAMVRAGHRYGRYVAQGQNT